MRSTLIHGLILISLVACADKPHTENAPEVVIAADTTSLGDTGRAGAPIPFPQVDDNISHDTLLIQTTFELGDGTYIMVASNNKAEEMLDAGDRNAGLRLYHYRLKKDGSAEILATSTSASDSWTIFPTFFEDPINNGSQIILANFGDRNSWGQKGIRFDDRGFHDLGFLNVAAIERVVLDAEVDTKLLNIAPHTRISSEGNDLVFRFLAEEILLYDDLRGGLDQTMAGDRVNYRWNANDGMVLYIDGEARRDQESS